MRVLAVLTLMSLSSCAHAQNYPYYVIDTKHDLLKAKSAEQDLKMSSVCAPTDLDESPCLAVMREVYFKMKRDLAELREALKEAQAGPAPQP